LRNRYFNTFYKICKAHTSYFLPVNLHKENLTRSRKSETGIIISPQMC
jgi:hypothetical protein